MLLIFIWVENLCAQQVEPLDYFKWLTGKWVRLDVASGKTAYEEWETLGDGSFKGRGVSMNRAETTFVEELSIINKDGKLYYVAEVTHNPEPTYFEITEISDQGFTCKNPTHDFPKKIVYQKGVQNELLVTISGGDRSAYFHFVKQP